MTIEKTFKLTIKDHVVYLTEKEVSELYEQCRKALNISYVNIPNNPTPNNPTPTYPSWPTYPGVGTPYYYGTVTAGTPPCHTDIPSSTSAFDWHTNASTNLKSTTGINFLSDDDIAVIEDNKKWRSSVEQALEKLKDKKP